MNSNICAGCGKVVPIKHAEVIERVAGSTKWFCTEKCAAASADTDRPPEQSSASILATAPMPSLARLVEHDGDVIAGDDDEDGDGGGFRQ